MYGNALDKIIAHACSPSLPLFLFNSLPSIKVNLIALIFAGTLLAISSQATTGGMSF